MTNWCFLYSQNTMVFWVYWFLTKNLAFLDPPSLKFHNRTDITQPHMGMQKCKYRFIATLSPFHTCCFFKLCFISRIEILSHEVILLDMIFIAHKKVMTWCLFSQCVKYNSDGVFLLNNWYQHLSCLIFFINLIDWYFLKKMSWKSKGFNLSIGDCVLCKRGLDGDNSYLNFLFNFRKRKL